MGDVGGESGGGVTIGGFGDVRLRGIGRITCVGVGLGLFMWTVLDGEGVRARVCVWLGLFMTVS